MKEVRVRRYNGEIKMVPEQTAQLKEQLGYYKYNKEEDIYEFTDNMNTLIEKRIKERKEQGV
jgi:hypothetical protein